MDCLPTIPRIIHSKEFFPVGENADGCRDSVASDRQFRGMLRRGLVVDAAERKRFGEVVLGEIGSQMGTLRPDRDPVRTHQGGELLDFGQRQTLDPRQVLQGGRARRKCFPSKPEEETHRPTT